MFFTREDILKIHNALLQLGVKDSELPDAEPVTYDDTLSIVQEGKNKQIKIEDFLIRFLYGKERTLLILLINMMNTILYYQKLLN